MDQISLLESNQTIQIPFNFYFNFVTSNLNFDSLHSTIISSREVAALSHTKLNFNCLHEN